MARGKNSELQEIKIRMDIRKKYFAMINHWYRLPKEVADAPFLEAFKAR